MLFPDVIFWYILVQKCSHFKVVVVVVYKLLQELEKFLFGLLFLSLWVLHQNGFSFAVPTSL